MTEPTDVRELREKIERADQMVTNLCKPRYTPNAREWTMSIPARPDHDPDLVIGAGLDAGRAALERLEKLEEHNHAIMTEVDLPPEYDGHTPADAAARLRAALLATPAPAPRQEADYEAALITLLGPQPDDFAGLLARRSILQHQLTLVEQALDRTTPARAPQQEPDAWVAEVYFKGSWGAPAIYRDRQDAEEHNRLRYDPEHHTTRVVPLYRAAPATQQTPRTPSVEEVEDAVGWGAGAWDTIDPAEIIEAVLRLSGTPAPQQGGTDD